MKAKYLLSVALLVTIGIALTGCAWLFAPRITAVLSATPTSGEAPLSVTFTLSGSTGNIVAYTLSFGDGEQVSGTDITTAVAYEYDEAGTYEAELTVQDTQGRTAKDTKTITVTEPDVPDTPEFDAWLSASEKTVGTGEEVNFSFGGSITPATGPKIESWELSYSAANSTLTTTNSITIIGTGTVDGYTFTDTKQYTFAASGTYNVTLAVIAEDATEVIKTVTISVLSAPPQITEFLLNGDPDPQTVSVAVTQTFSFKAEADTGRKLVKWELTFGDGFSKMQEDLNVDTFDETRTRTYTQTGSYTATVKVWDDLDAQDSKTLTFTVE